MKPSKTHRSSNLSIHRFQGKRKIGNLNSIGWEIAAGLVLLCALLLVGCSNGIERSTAVADQPTNSVEPEAEGMRFFKGSFEAALAQAELEQKKVFVDVYTTWCGPCIVMQETIFPLPEVGEYFNERFVNFKFDAENEDENGPELAARYDIGVYPTYLILESDGTEISRANSSMSGPQFVTLVGRMLGEVSGNFEEMVERYEAGERSEEFVQQFLMDAIVEFSLSDVPSDDATAMMEYYERGDKFKKIASEYFETKQFHTLTNAVDAQLVLHYKDKTPRGDDLVEFVLENYGDFLAVSSPSAMSQFALNATWYAALDEAQDGNESYLSFIEDLEADPLSQAAEYERSRDPKSRVLPEAMKERVKMIYLETIEDWDSIYIAYQDQLANTGDPASAQAFASAARLLSRSNNPEHQTAAIEYGRQGFELDTKDPFVASNYISALVAADLRSDAEEVVETYRSGLTDSAADQDKLDLFDRITVWALNPPSESDVSTE
ncbi:MAG: thioredoxin family protein [Gammaproteobacteria bacterium]|nr:thioredoxin family protein [Gammaproteobacteria bacterium]